MYMHNWVNNDTCTCSTCSRVHVLTYMYMGKYPGQTTVRDMHNVPAE